ncbi:hypothetical protein K8R43_00050 [archaeon]|nr:hypothetical protein [archaeon]
MSSYKKAFKELRKKESVPHEKAFEEKEKIELKLYTARQAHYGSGSDMIVVKAEDLRKVLEDKLEHGQELEIQSPINLEKSAKTR